MVIDGWAQCYYFGNTGYAMTDYGRADGYEIDKNGAWSVNSVTQVKSVPTDVEENDPEAMEVYEEAQQLNETLKSENIDVNYRITTSYLEETLDMTMDMNIKMREARKTETRIPLRRNIQYTGSRGADRDVLYGRQHVCGHDGN